MKVKWQDFAKRRKIKIENFHHMDYDEYSRWCAARSVEPVTRDTFPQVTQPLVEAEIPLEENTPTATRKTMTLKGLSKMKKTDIQSLCDESNVVYTFQTTKKQLIQKLLELNNL